MYFLAEIECKVRVALTLKLGPFEFLQGLRAYCPNIFNIRWRILRLPAKLRPIILPFASTSLALVSSETV